VPYPLNDNRKQKCLAVCKQQVHQARRQALFEFFKEIPAKLQVVLESITKWEIN
jgi:hypothetical protein